MVARNTNDLSYTKQRLYILYIVKKMPLEVYLIGTYNGDEKYPNEIIYGIMKILM